MQHPGALSVQKIINQLYRISYMLLFAETYKHSSSVKSVCFRKATQAASSSGGKTVERVFLGPVGTSSAKGRCRYFKTVLE
jgi:hypothetical protein